ncbi:DNA primase family protein [Streptomyces yaizuensis]|uniref:Phage/plasmid primase, P4 family n=1 Tax=Streptomyces yaizuensis TaxID=2989713 RepID=A0ABQ5P6L3_9ACTN|nr:phage/plasmid primase, P4 family [Streptomyces sp. YSPA8]GLF98224.1 phage/plasmid primase, P4 family [Streptomyces sp. YSPA8]
MTITDHDGLTVPPSRGPAPRPAAAAALRADPLPPAPGESGPAAVPLVPRSLTDRGNATLFQRVYGEDFRYVPNLGWYRWAGYRWAVDVEARAVSEAAFELAENLSPRDPSERFTARQLARHINRSLNDQGNSALIRVAKKMPAFHLAAEALDRDPYALCTPDGVVDLRTGVVREPHPSQFHTRSALCAPREMPTPMWDQYLLDTFGPGPKGRALTGYMQQMMGYTITGLVSAQVLPFLHGDGGNGKSVLVGVLQRLLADYADTAPHDFLMAKAYSDHPTELADLQGRRLIVCNELNPGARFDQARMTLLTGSDRIKARKVRQDFFSFWPTHTLWLIGNHRPAVPAGGKGFWRRIRLIPFEQNVTRVISDLDVLLVEAEGPGILHWIVQGTGKYLNGDDPHLKNSAQVAAATRDYAQAEDTFGRFLADCCRLGDPATLRTEQRTLRLAYQSWCEDEGVDPVPPRRFGENVRRVIHHPAGTGLPTSNGRKIYKGIALTNPPAPAQGPK